MGCSLVKVVVHIVFHIKTTSPIIFPEDLTRVFEYIGGIINGVGGIPIQVGGMMDHIHILATLPSTSSIADFVKTIKAESSRWIKQLNDSYHNFAWQSGYGAFSVSSSVIEKTVEYIKKQKEHHEVKTFFDEYRTILDLYKIKYDEQYLFSD